MPSSKKTQSFLFHRLQVARARQYLRAHATRDVTLGEVARAAGASVFHFARLYHALTRETVFQSITRMRLHLAVRRLCDVPRAPVSEIALAVGYRTPSSFNKALRLVVGVSPTELRAAAPGAQRALLASLAARARLEPPRRAIRLSRAPEMRRLPPTRFLHVRELGPYTEVAPLAWSKLSAILSRSPLSLREAERIGASYDDPRAVSEELLRYDAGIAVASNVAPPPGTRVSRLEGGDYAVFQYRGAHRYIADAFARIFRGWVLRSGARVRAAACLEIYVNDLGDTRESDLSTELLVPVEVSR